MPVAPRLIGEQPKPVFASSIVSAVWGIALARGVPDRILIAAISMALRLTLRQVPDHIFNRTGAARRERPRADSVPGINTRVAKMQGTETSEKALQQLDFGHVTA